MLCLILIMLNLRIQSNSNLFEYIYAYINWWWNYCVIGEGIDVVECQKKVTSSRTSHVTYAAYVVQCQKKVVSSGYVTFLGC